MIRRLIAWLRRKPAAVEHEYPEIHDPQWATRMFWGDTARKAFDEPPQVLGDWNE